MTAEELMIRVRVLCRRSYRNGLMLGFSAGLMLGAIIIRMICEGNK